MTIWVWPSVWTHWMNSTSQEDHNKWAQWCRVCLLIFYLLQLVYLHLVRYIWLKNSFYLPTIRNICWFFSQRNYLWGPISRTISGKYNQSKSLTKVFYMLVRKTMDTDNQSLVNEELYSRLSQRSSSWSENILWLHKSPQKGQFFPRSKFEL